MPLSILIIGSGAIGSLMAAQLARAGQPVTLVCRPATAAAIDQHDLQVSQGGVTTTVKQVRPVTSLAAAFAGQSTYRLSVWAVKGYHTAATLAELQAATPAPPPVLTLQNGVGNEEILAAALGPQGVIAGVITSPVSVVAPAHIALEGRKHRVGLADLVGLGGTTSHPSPALAATQVAGLLVSAGFQARVYSHWQSLKWTKLIMNLLCNASCALLGWTPAQVWADPRLATMEIVAWREAMAVLRGLGCRLENVGGYPLRWLGPLLRGLPPATLRPLLGRFVVGGRGGKMPSLYLDLAGGRVRSEVEWLNGAVVKAARGLAVPANRALYEILSAVVLGVEPWERYRDRPEELLDQWGGL